MQSFSGIIFFVFGFLIIFYIVLFIRRRRIKKRRLAEEAERRNRKNEEKEAADEVASLKIDYIDKDEFIKIVQEEVHQGDKPKKPSRKIEFKF